MSLPEPGIRLYGKKGKSEVIKLLQTFPLPSTYLKIPAERCCTMIWFPLLYLSVYDRMHSGK